MTFDQLVKHHYLDLIHVEVEVVVVVVVVEERKLIISGRVPVLQR